MNQIKRRVAWLAPWVLALAAVLAPAAPAQASGTGALGAEDMRLWSFGDCDRRFPYTNTDEHKECVRVVGSPEAKDARALRICAVSNAQDPAEIERCRAAYQANKEKAVRDGVVPNASAVAQTPPSAEVMRNVKAITAAAVEANRAAAGNDAAPPAPVEEAAPSKQPEESSVLSTVGIVFLVLALLGLVAALARRRQAASA
jgi:hypothetical protein